MDLLKIGQKASIFIYKENKIVEISCTISGLGDDRIALDLPQYFMRYIEFLEVGAKLTVKVFSRMGTVDFNAIVISSPLEEAFILELDYNAMKLTPIADLPPIGAIESMKLKRNDTEFFVKTFELSLNKIKFYSDKSYNLNELFDCELFLPQEYGKITFRGELTEIDPIYDSEYGISCMGMSEEDVQTLLYYMYVYDNQSDRE